MRAGRRPDAPRPGRDELQWRFSTSGGPGGQHVNTANTRVECRFDIASARCLSDEQRRRLLDVYGGEIVVVCEETRSQWRNRQRAYERLLDRIVEGLSIAPARVRTKLPRAAHRRRRDAKARRAATKALRRRPEPE